MRKIFIGSALALAWALAAPAVLAQEVAPDVLLTEVTREVLDIIRQDKDLFRRGTRRKSPRWSSRRSSRTSISLA